MLKNIAKKLLTIIFERQLPPLSSAEKVFLPKFRIFFRKLPILETRSTSAVQMKKTIRNVVWANWRIGHMRGNNYYLIGRNFEGGITE